MARCFIGLCLVALLVAVATARPAEPENPKAEKAATEVTTEAPEAGPAEKAYLFLKKIFTMSKYRGSCIARSMDNCGYNIGKPKNLYNCYSKYFDDHQEACLKKKKPE